MLTRKPFNGRFAENPAQSFGRGGAPDADTSSAAVPQGTAAPFQSCLEPPTRIPLRNGDEFDALCVRCRRILTWTKRPGACRAAKRSYARRLRHTVRLVLKAADGE
jgi:hypothetical protein